MYAVVRSYRAGPELADLLIGEVVGVKQAISAIEGFQAYYLVRTAEGALSFSVFEDEAGAEESSAVAAQWIRENLPAIGGVTPEVTGGEVVTSA